MTEPVSCGHFEDLAVLYALGELEADARGAVEDHARACPECAAVLRRETTLATILGPANRPIGEPEPSGLQLARCRNKLSRTLDDNAAALRPRIWTSLFSPREWMASLRVSPKLHPAWSVAALLVIGALSGLAGWEGIGRLPHQMLGPAVITVLAAPPPPAAPATPVAPVPPHSTAANSAANDPVYAASRAGMNDAFSRGLFESEPIPRTRRHEPPLRMPAGLSAAATWDAPADGSLSQLSRRMETLWWGGVRVDPAEQQKRLVVGQLPEYPEVARRAGIEGDVTMLLRIGTDGAVDDVEQLSGEPILGRAATEAIDQWRYSPPRIGGQPANIVTSVTLSFQLR